MENTARVIHPEFAAGRRILAVSDIHGNLPFFRGLLQKVRFTPEDILVLDGDMLEKGRDSLALLRYMMELSRTHTVYPICGNCDGLVFRFFETDELDGRFYASYLPQHPESTIRQLADEMGFEDWMDFPGLRAALRERYPEIHAWLAGLPTILETEHLVFVHGGGALPGAYGDPGPVEVHEKRRLPGTGALLLQVRHRGTLASDPL